MEKRYTYKAKDFVTLICDASFCHQSQAGGWGAWIASNGHRIKVARAFHAPIEDPLSAETFAILNGLSIVSKKFPDTKRILIQSDCTGALAIIRRIIQLKQTRDKRIAKQEKFYGIGSI